MTPQCNQNKLLELKFLKRLNQLAPSQFRFAFAGRFDEGFRADLVVGNIVLVELKSVESLARVHKKQVLTYLRTFSP
jgi:GxxExxY protein